MKFNIVTFKTLTWMLIFGFAGSLMFACGPSVEDETAEDKKETKERERKAKEKAAEPTQEIELTVVATGNTMAEIAFDVEEITVPANALVHLTLINKSEAAGMDHNFVVVHTDQLDDVVQAGIQSGPDSEFIPKGHKGLIAASPLAAPQETITFEFVTPSKPGDYTFICLYPGHVNAMQGTFIVEVAGASDESDDEEEDSDDMTDEVDDQTEKAEDEEITEEVEEEIAS